jgi:hypothetical protein
MKSVYIATVFLLLLSSAAAQNNGAVATVQSVRASQDGTDVRVEITLSAAVEFSVEKAENPDRILLDFPDTTCNSSTKSVAVNRNGISRVRTAQHSTNPMVTRVVLDLDQPHQYTVKSEGNVVTLTVSTGEPLVARTPPVAATSGNLVGIFHRRRESAPVLAGPDDVPPAPQAPATVASGPEPRVQNSTAESTPPPPPVVERPKIPASLQNSSPQSSPEQSSPANIPQAAVVSSLDGTQTAKSDMPPLPVAVAPASKPAAPASNMAVSGKNDAPIPPVPVAKETTPPTANNAVVAVSPAAASPVPATTTKSEVPAQTVVSQPAPSTVEAPVPTVSPAVPAPVAPPVVAASEPPVKENPAPAVATNSVPATAAETAAPVETTPEASSASSAEAGTTTVAGGSSAMNVPLTTAETSTLIARSDDPNLHTVFKVKYVADGVAYLEGGRAQGLAEGMKLLVIDTKLPATQGTSANTADPRVIAELEVSAVAETSSVSDIHTPKRPVKVGDLAYLSTSDAEAMVQQRTLSATRQYPAVVSFTEGDTLDEEVRDILPKPPLPSVNRARGRIGFDSIETISRGTSSVTSSDVGVVFRGDITRIGGTYWNISGYWRGRLTKESVQSQQTLQNLINRTYHLNMTYDNPNSVLVAGFGRLYLPWASSLDTIDGGYFGARLTKGTTLGVFGGSTPDPSSWDYSPNRAIGGAFINFEGGEFNGFHYSSTAGAGVSMISWNVDRPFIFIEDNLSYKRGIAIYEAAQLDDPRGNSVTPSPGPGLGRNFSTLRVNPFSRVEMDFNYNYFRQVPTFDPILIGTSLLDKYLFQGFSAGGRVEVLNQVWLSTNLGRSSGSGDAKTSLNQMYGITFGRLPWIGLRADGHYAKFNGSFGSGSYESVALSKQLRDRLRLELLVGQQNFISTITANNRSRFVTGTVETTLGPHYYLQGNFTTNRGDMSYDQMMFSIGYRFDTKQRRRE